MSCLTSTDLEHENAGARIGLSDSSDESEIASERSRSPRITRSCVSPARIVRARLGDVLKLSAPPALQRFDLRRLPEFDGGLKLRLDGLASRDSRVTPQIER
jgi:hypothetical protein